jgi:hypothetical protein
MKILKFYYPLPIIVNIYWTHSLPMVFWPPYPWYIDPLNHGILTLLTMVYRPSTHGILTPLPMVYRPPYPWYIDLLPMVYQTLSYGIMNSSLLGEMRGLQFTMMGFKIQWQKIDPGVKIPYGKLNPGSKYHR